MILVYCLFLALVKQPVSKKENFTFKTVLLSLKIDLVSHPTHVAGNQTETGDEKVCVLNLSS